MDILWPLFCENIFNNWHAYRKNGIATEFNYLLLHLYLLITEKSPWAMIKAGWYNYRWLLLVSASFIYMCVYMYIFLNQEYHSHNKLIAYD